MLVGNRMTGKLGFLAILSVMLLTGCPAPGGQPGTPSPFDDFSVLTRGISAATWYFNPCFYGEYLLLPNVYAGMDIFDVSSPGAPVKISSVCYTPGGGNWDIAISGHYAFLMQYRLYRMLVIDLSDVTQPRLAAEMNLGPRHPISVAASGAAAAVACTNENDSSEYLIYMVDQTDGENPAITNTIMLSDSIAYGGSKDCLSLDGNIVCVVTGWGKDVQIIDSTTGATLATITDGEATSLEQADNRLYITGNNEFRVFDISDPASPVLLKSVALPATETSHALDFSLCGSFACVSGLDSLYTIDFTDMEQAALANTVDLPRINYQPGVWFINRIAVKDGLWAVSDDYTDTILLYDCADAGPASPVFSAAINSWNGNTKNIVFSPDGAFAYAVGDDGGSPIPYGEGLQVIDRGNPQNITTVALPPCGLLAVSGNRLFTGSHSWAGGYVRMLDIGNPGSPVLLDDVISFPANAFGDPFRVERMEAHDAYVFVSGLHERGGINNWELHIIAADSGAIMGSIESVLDGWDFALRGDFVFVSRELSATMSVFDISDPSRPVLAAELPGSGLELTASGDRLYVDNGVAITIIDITNPVAPVVSGSFSIDDHFMPFSVSGDYLFAMDENELKIYNISDPRNVLLVKTLANIALAVGTDYNRDCAPVFFNNRIYIPCGRAGVTIVGEQGGLNE